MIKKTSLSVTTFCKYLVSYFSCSENFWCQNGFPKWDYFEIFLCNLSKRLIRCYFSSFRMKVSFYFSWILLKDLTSHFIFIKCSSQIGSRNRNRSLFSSTLKKLPVFGFSKFISSVSDSLHAFRQYWTSNLRSFWNLLEGWPFSSWNLIFLLTWTMDAKGSPWLQM